MTSDEHQTSDGPEPPDNAASDLSAHADERFFEAGRGPSEGQPPAAALVAVLLVYAALLLLFLWHDRNDRTQVAQITETPVEIVQEPPPPPPPPPPPKQQPEPPKPKEDLRPSLSAPRAPNETKIDTQKMQDKTSAPKAPTPPSEGQPAPRPQSAPPKDEAKAQAKEDEAAKEEDTSKPDAEALDKAKPKVAKEAKTKAAKATPKRKKTTNDLFASLAGQSVSPDLSFAKPTPKTKIYGGTDDVRWMAEVEAALEAKVSQLPRTAHWQAGGQVVIFFHVDVSGRVIAREIVVKSGYPDVDAIAMRALAAAEPFPPPPPGIEHGLEWSSVFDGQLPTLHIEKK